MADSEHSTLVLSESDTSSSSDLSSDNSSSDSSSRSRSLSPSNRSKHKKKKKKNKKKNKKSSHRKRTSKHKKHKKKKEKKSKKKKRKKKPKKSSLVDDDVHSSVTSIPLGLKKPSSVLAPTLASQVQLPKESKELDKKKKETSSRGPMTKAAWDKKQSVIRHVFDPLSGRNRLVRGDGEIIEEIVSRDRQKDINKFATKWDGHIFQQGR